MYPLGAAVPLGDVAPRTTLLCVGPSMSGQETVLYRALAAAAMDGAGVVVVSTDESAHTARERLKTAVDDAGGTDADRGGLGVVDCTGDAADADGGGDHVRGVSSPADLTGLWMATTDLVETLAASHGRVVVVLDSLTTLSVYADPDRLLEFANSFVRGIASAGAVALVSVDDDAIPVEVLHRVESFVDARLEVRPGEDGAVEARVTGGDGPTAWTSVTPIERGRSDRPPGRAPLCPPDEVDPSLIAIIEAVTGELTLTVRGYDGSGAVLDRLRSYFDRQSVAVRTVGADLDAPSGYALLHRGEELLAGADADSLAAAIEVDGDALGGGSRDDERSAASVLLSAAGGSVYGGREAGTELLVRASRTIESLAWRRGEGRIHAGFQRLSRLTADSATYRVYRRLADRDVSLHLYGAPDVDLPDWPGTRIHPADESATELRDSWFVVYDGGGTAADAAALVAVRTGGADEFDHPLDATYRAFWTHRPETAARTLAYLESTYAGGRRPRGRDPDPDPSPNPDPDSVAGTTDGDSAVDRHG